MNIYLLFIFTGLCIISGSEYFYKGKGIFSCLLLLLVVLFLLLVSTRSIFITSDSEAYKEALNTFNTFKWYKSYAETPGGFGLAFVYFSQLFCLFFGENVKLYFCTIAIFNVIFMMITYKKFFNICNCNKFYCIGFALYCSFYGILYNAVVLRSGMAISCIILSFIYILEDKKVKCIILLLLAYLFHPTAILGIIPIVIVALDIRFDKSKFIFISLSLGIIWMVTSINDTLSIWIIKKILLLGDNIYRSHYLSDLLNIETSISLKFLFFYIISILGLKYYNNDKVYSYLLLIYDIGLFLYFTIHMTRIGDYLAVFGVLLIYRALNNVRNKSVGFSLYIIIIVCNIILSSRIVHIII